MRSAIYEGQVRHRRFAPRAHSFSYRLFMMYLDLDELPALFERHPLWSNEGRALARFRRLDHLKNHAPTSCDLSGAVRDLVQSRTGRRPQGPIRLLTHLEYFRYRFNPVSFYFCHNAAGEQIDAIVAEINNTPWGEQYCYVLSPTAKEAARGKFRFNLSKAFHVSPFMDMQQAYDWRFTAPADRLAIHMDSFANGAKIFDATMGLQRRPITRSALTGVLLRFPFITLKVIAAIHWQALRLWMKGCPSFPHPAAEDHANSEIESC